MDVWIQNVAWIGMGLVAASAIWLVAVLVFKRFRIEIGTLRPQVMVVLLSLSIVTVWALGDNETHNIATLAVGGMIALATRIIEKDGGSDDVSEGRREGASGTPVEDKDTDRTAKTE